METLYIKIYRATDTFLYLPAYIAEDLGVLETILEDAYKEYKFDIQFVTSVNKGDEGAISEMLQNTNENTIAIAIGSPVGFLNSKEKKFENVKVVGAIINKLTFWALAKDAYHLEEIDDGKGGKKKREEISEFKEKFKNIIYPKQEYVTAHHAGNKFAEEAEITNRHYKNVDFGDEIKNVTAEKINSVVITADIVSLSEAISLKANNYYINYSFPKKQGEFLTTGIITSKASCERFPGIIEKIVDSIQMSIAVFYTSKKTAKNNCKRVVDRLTNCDQNTTSDEDSIKKIVDLMYEEEFYPKHDLRVTRESWEHAVTAFLNGTTQKEANVLFDKYVNNDFVLKSTTKRLSIDLDAPREPRPCKKNTNGGCSTIALLQKQLEELQEKQQYYVEWLWKITMFLKENKILSIITFVLFVILMTNLRWDFISQGMSILISICFSVIILILGVKVVKSNKEKRQ